MKLKVKQTLKHKRGLKMNLYKVESKSGYSNFFLQYFKYNEYLFFKEIYSPALFNQLFKVTEYG